MKRLLLPLVLITQPVWAMPECKTPLLPGVSCYRRLEQEERMKLLSNDVVEDCNYPSTWTPVVDPETKVISFIVTKSELCK